MSLNVTKLLFFSRFVSLFCVHQQIKIKGPFSRTSRSTLWVKRSRFVAQLLLQAKALSTTNTACSFCSSSSTWTYKPQCVQLFKLFSFFYCTFLQYIRTHTHTHISMPDLRSRFFCYCFMYIYIYLSLSSNNRKAMKNKIHWVPH